MGKKLYHGNIPFSATDESIREFFSDYTVTSVKIITDRETGRPRGFAFVELATEDEVRDAVAKLDGTDMGGRTVVVNEAKEREKPTRERR